MSLESKIEALTLALQANTAALQAQAGTAPVAPAMPAPVAAAPVAPAPVQAAPTFAPPAAAPAMPPAPTFAPPAPAAPVGVPFNDTVSLVKYAVEAYGVLGAEKGAHIQTIITQMGKATINDLTPDQYPQFYAAVEALKAA